jgi:hypothetical protein
MTGRLLLASILAPPAAVFAAWAGFVGTSAVALLPRGQPIADVASGGLFLLGFFIAFGLPLALVASVLAGPAYFYLQDTGRLSRRNVMVMTAALGGVSVVVIWSLMFGFRFGLTQLPSGVLAGAVGGFVFWAVGLRRPSHPPAA